MCGPWDAGDVVWCCCMDSLLCVIARGVVYLPSPMLRAASDHLEAMERVDGLSGTRVNTPWRNLQCRRRPPACAPRPCRCRAAQASSPGVMRETNRADRVLARALHTRARTSHERVSQAWVAQRCTLVGSAGAALNLPDACTACSGPHRLCGWIHGEAHHILYIGDMTGIRQRPVARLQNKHNHAPREQDRAGHSAAAAM
jgi:hypothetical protein